MERANKKFSPTSLLSRSTHGFTTEELPMVQRIMNTVEKASKDVTPVQLILNNSISLSKQILMSKMRPTGQIDLSSMSGYQDRTH